MTQITATSISKRYGRRNVLTERSLMVSGGERVGLVGPNGSGKSTLLRILSGLQRPDDGTVDLVVNGVPIPREIAPHHAGLVAPYLNVYDEFTPMELLELQAKMHGEAHSTLVEGFIGTLERVGLADRRNDTVRTFSSGLRQRCVLALAVHRQPAVLFFDEPTITLDEAGIRIVEGEILAQSARGGIVILATNDVRERQQCSRLIDLALP